MQPHSLWHDVSNCKFCLQAKLGKAVKARNTALTNADALQSQAKVVPCCSFHISAVTKCKDKVHTVPSVKWRSCGALIGTLLQRHCYHASLLSI